ncbi:MAG: fibronectin type III domain-containing protein [Patescibacteria group bacterium]
MKNKLILSVLMFSFFVPVFANANLLNSKVALLGNGNVPNLKTNTNIEAKIDSHIGNASHNNGANMGIGATVSAEHRNDDHDKSYATSTDNGDKDKGENGGWFNGLWHSWFGNWFNWNHATSTPDAFVVVRNVTASNIGTSTAEITWNTNASTTGELRYATNANDVKASTNVLSDTSLGASHKIVLSGLNPNTKYYFEVTAKDAAGNTKQSGINSFTTKSESSVDTSAPSILFNTVISVGTSDSRVIWITNEASNSKIWVSESESIGTDGTDNAGSLNLGYVHDLKVSGLKSGTKYFYKVQSTDASGNVTTSDAGSFTTK